MIKLKDPIKSMRARARYNAYMRGRPVNPFWLAPNPRNRHGIGGNLPGEVRNPHGSLKNPTQAQIEGRRKAQVKIGEVRNPYGRKGLKSVGLKKMDKRKRTKEGEDMAIDAREAQRLSRESMRKAIERVAAILDDPAASDMAAIAAFHALADRAYGKATQTNVNANLDVDANPRELKGNELDKRITETLERVERLTKRKRETLVSEDGHPDLRSIN